MVDAERGFNFEKLCVCRADEIWSGICIAGYRCGGGDPIAAAREQWNDGSNTLAIAPGRICVYQRNSATNEALAKAGLELVVLPSSELSRGRGGPRCMSMPFVRDAV